MKRKLHFKNILALLLLLVYSPSEAKRITQWQAQQQAYSFWGKQMPQKAPGDSYLLIVIFNTQHSTFNTQHSTLNIT